MHAHMYSQVCSILLQHCSQTQTHVAMRDKAADSKTAEHKVETEAECIAAAAARCTELN